jgi:pimeloyl-ACP methyl ester carboxylesterase
VIDTLEAIQIGGTAQWIRVRGVDASNPPLLLIQQGPGLPMINEARRFEHVLGLEQRFTVVYWDQRGCGRSLRGPKHPVELSLKRLVADTVSLLDVPVVMVQGRHDQVAPAEAAQRYADSLQAPSKRLVWFEDSAHTPHLDEPDKFRNLLVKLRSEQLENS